MKKKTAMVFSLLTVFSLGLSTAASAAVLGDVNNDGAVTAKDFTRLGKYLFAVKELDDTGRSNADLNGDGIINIADYILEKELLINGGAVQEGVMPPEFSVESGFYNNEFSVTLSAADGVQIYYTTDGSEPTVSSQRYSGQIRITNRTSEPNVYSAITDVSADNLTPPNVTKGTVVKAIAVDRDGKVSEIASKSYFVGIDIGSQYNGFPVMSLTIDPDDFFDNERGIYVRGKVYQDWLSSGNTMGVQAWEKPGNFTQRGEEWERPVYMEIFEKDGALAHAQKIGVRISGNATRQSVVKSLKFFAREEYGKKNVKYELIPGAVKQLDHTTPLDKYKKFVMRNGGNDLGHAQFRDNYLQSLFADRAFETQASRPAVMFINGEFWGVYTLQEVYSDNYIQENYDIDNNNVIVIECGEVDDGNPEDKQLYDQMINFARDNDLTVPSNYAKMNEMMDMQSYIDYFCAEIYIGNQDWMNNNNNYRVWRSRTVSDNPYEDGKWRWMMYDTEYCMGLYGNMMGSPAAYDTLNDALYGSQGFGGMGGFGGWGGGNQNTPQTPAEHTVMFYKLMQNQEFKQRFINTMCDMMNTNIETQHMLDVLDQFERMYTPVMEEQLQRVKSPDNGFGGGGFNWGDMNWGNQDQGDMNWGNQNQGGFDWGNQNQGGFDWNNQNQGGFDWSNMGGNVMAPGDQTSMISSFTSEVSTIRSFVQNRAQNIYSIMSKHLGISGMTAELTVQTSDRNAGKVKINTITPDYNGNSWSGKYCTDVPVTLTAVPADGYRFAGWSGAASGSSQTITVDVSSAASVKAEFARN